MVTLQELIHMKQILHKVLTKDKIIDRFRKYFGGKKGKKERLK